MLIQQFPSSDRLTSLPDKLLSRIFSYLCPIGDGLTLVCTSRTHHKKLIVRLYKEAGRKLDWFPLLFGVTEGKIPVLERCLEAGAPLDYRWPYVGHFRSLGYYEDFRYCQPLDWAEWSEQETRKWLVKKKATSA
ncbi:hypothetical protein NCS56_00009400 [Fusarium sp. Ph1]|nr:hypothetical protein NCS56_00009400 [Fusarium sp. Ph1]